MHLASILRKASGSQKSHETSSSKVSKLSAKVLSKVKHLVRKFDILSRKLDDTNSDQKPFKPCHVKPSKSNDLLSAIAHLGTCDKHPYLGSDGSIDHHPIVVGHLHELYMDNSPTIYGTNNIEAQFKAFEERLRLLADYHHGVLDTISTDIEVSDWTTLIPNCTETNDFDWASSRADLSTVEDPQSPIIESDPIAADDLSKATMETAIGLDDALQQSILEIKPRISYPNIGDILPETISDVKSPTGTRCTPLTPETPIRAVGTPPSPKTSETDIIARKVEKMKGKYRDIAIRQRSYNSEAFACPKLQEALGLKPPCTPRQHDDDEADDIFYTPPTRPREGRALLPSGRALLPEGRAQLPSPEPVMGNPPTTLWHPRPERTWRPVVLCKYS